MHVISVKTLREFWEAGNADAEEPLKAWFAEAQKAIWNSPADIKARYANASIVEGNRVVFNIHSNKYRLVVAIRYQSEKQAGVVFVRFIGSHAEYDKIDAEKV